MANSGRITRGNASRVVQYGLDKVIDHYSKDYKGVGERIFTKVTADKAFYEALQMSGMGLASRKGEGASITYDSLDQDLNSRWAIHTWEKSARITMESIEDDLYGVLQPKIGKAIAMSLARTRDYNMAAVLNNAFTDSDRWDGTTLCSTAHPLQAGGTNANRLSTDLDFSEDALESYLLLIDDMVGPDGQLLDAKAKNLIVPSALRFESSRVLNSQFKTMSAQNDINAVKHEGDIGERIVWKRLSDPDAFFIQTDMPDCLLFATRRGVLSSSDKDTATHDIFYTSTERYRALAADYRGLVGSAGAS